MLGASPCAQAGAPGAAPPGFGGGQVTSQQAAAEQQKLQAEQLRKFWGEMKKEAAEHSTEPADFKNQQLPLARIKKVPSGPGHAAGARAWQPMPRRRRVWACGRCVGEALMCMGSTSEVGRPACPACLPRRS
jgi:hypothetical protein